MLRKINGKVIEINKDNITLLVNDIGFEIYVSNPNYFKINEVYYLYVFDYLTENSIILFGFNEIDELIFFKFIISLEGYGPKKTLNIFKNIEVNELKRLIILKDTSTLRKIPGIGKNSDIFISKLYSKVESTCLIDDKNKNVYDTLINLGFDSKNIKNMILSLPSSLNEEEMIKLSIQKLKRS